MFEDSFDPRTTQMSRGSWATRYCAPQTAAPTLPGAAVAFHGGAQVV